MTEETKCGENSWAITSCDAVFGEDAIYCFKKEYYFKNPEKACINITADARYKLKINEKVVSFGPYKARGKYHYYETVDISKYLKDGKNLFEAEVLQLRVDKDIAHHRYLASVPRTGNIILLIWGTVDCEDGIKEINTDASWLCAKNENYEFFVPQYAWYGGMCEKISDEKALKWENAKELFQKKHIMVNGEVLIWQLMPSCLPKQRYEKVLLSQKDGAGNYDFGKLTTGFIRVKAKGNGRLRLTYAECYVFEDEGKDVKRDRIDVGGVIKGDCDIIEVRNGAFEYETFWFRTFRFIKVECEGEIEVEEISVFETGYPLKVEEGYDFGNDRDNRLWEISVNTLKNCMHETYEDCPYYEQFQYAMDAYMQMLFAMKLSEDVTLTKRAIEDFACSISVGDFTQAKYPAIMAQYIPGFSLYFIFMLDSLEKNRNEREFIKKYLGTVDNIIMSFENMKRDDGLLVKNDRWCFVDWADGWENGVPRSDEGDALCVYSLMYAYALEKAARLCRLYKRNCTAEEYEKNADAIKAKVLEECYCKENGLFADTDKKRTFSQHAQIWAVLTGIVKAEDAKRIMRRSVNLTAKGGFAYAYHVFRAFEMIGEYELTEDLMSKYYKLLDENCTTVPETPENPRSECHGWGTAPIYEFTTVILGVKERDDCVLVKPYMDGRRFAKGYVFTKFGRVYTEWAQTKNEVRIYVKADEDVRVTIVTPDGEIVENRQECEWKSKEIILK